MPHVVRIVYAGVAVLIVFLSVQAFRQNNHDRARAAQVRSVSASNCARSQAILSYLIEQQNVLTLVDPDQAKLLRPAVTRLLKIFDGRPDCPNLSLWIPGR